MASEIWVNRPVLVLVGFLVSRGGVYRVGLRSDHSYWHDRSRLKVWYIVVGIQPTMSGKMIGPPITFGPSLWKTAHWWISETPSTQTSNNILHCHFYRSDDKTLQWRRRIAACNIYPLICFTFSSVEFEIWRDRIHSVPLDQNVGGTCPPVLPESTPNDVIEPD